MEAGKEAPSIEQWLREAKAHPDAGKVGMYLVHNGTVRQTAKAKVRHGQPDAPDVKGMYFSHDPEKLDKAIAKARQMEGIYYVRAWLNSGMLAPGDDIMYILVGGDIRPRVVTALETLVEEIKTQCVLEIEHQ